MSTKGSWTRVKDRVGFDRRKERIFMDTWDLQRLLVKRSLSGLETTESAQTTFHWIYTQAGDLAYDVSIIVDPKAEEARALRRLILDLHERLDELEESQ